MVWRGAETRTADDEIEDRRRSGEQVFLIKQAGGLHKPSMHETF